MTNFEEIHAQLRQVMIDEGKGNVIASDEPGNLILRTVEIDSKTGKPGWFGTVTTKKSYVAYHLMPLYTDASLAEGISPALAKRMQGKTCFNFKSHDAALFAEIAALTRKANKAA